jgi:hypothetical protein
MHISIPLFMLGHCSFGSGRNLEIELAVLLGNMPFSSKRALIHVTTRRCAYRAHADPGDTGSAGWRRKEKPTEWAGQPHSCASSEGLPRLTLCLLLSFISSLHLFSHLY